MEVLQCCIIFAAIWSAQGNVKLQRISFVSFASVAYVQKGGKSMKQNYFVCLFVWLRIAGSNPGKVILRAFTGNLGCEPTCLKLFL